MENTIKNVTTTPVVAELKIEDAAVAQATKAQPASQKSSEPIPSVSETVSEPKAKGKRERKQEPDYDYIVTFVGHGVWTDANGMAWAKNHENPEIKSERRYTEDEFSGRDDIHFMIKYGSMTLIEV